jgi:zinc D-Ala-D-Ala carboxypeptidase
MNHFETLQTLGITEAAILSRGLFRYDEALVLELVEVNTEGREFMLAPSAAVAWRAMKTAAASDNIPLNLVSAHRSVARQIEIIRAKLDDGMVIAEILKLVAPPGYSEHHTGRAVDIASCADDVLEEIFENTASFAWLQIHAGEYGFTLSYPRGNALGYAYEPWHWCFSI